MRFWQRYDDWYALYEYAEGNVIQRAVSNGNLPLGLTTGQVAQLNELGFCQLLTE